MNWLPCAAAAPGCAPADGAGGGMGRAAAVGAVAEAPAGAAPDDAAIAASISCLVMRPPAPLPSRVERSTPCSFAMRRTNGEEWIRSAELAGGAAAGTGAGAGAAGLAATGTAAGSGFAAGADAAGAGPGAGADDAADPAPSITATIVWIGT